MENPGPAMAYGLALDLGTSGYRTHLVDLDDHGKIISTAITMRHPLPGANVMDHLHFWIENGAEVGHEIIKETIDKLICLHQVDYSKISKIAICGNPIQLSHIWDVTWIFVLLNFVANKAWEVLFFEYRQNIAAAIDAVILWVTAIVVVSLWARTDGSYGVPIVIWSIYIVWLTYAMVLSIWIAAKGKSTTKLTMDQPGWAQAVMNGEMQ